MKEFLDSCITCPAALVCRSTGRHYTGMCAKCRNPWIVMLHDKNSNRVHIVRFSKGHVCDEKEHLWRTADKQAFCPECCGPGRGKLGQWHVVYGKEIFYVNFDGPSPKFSKI